jgi:hypothetical protein
MKPMRYRVLVGLAAILLTACPGPRGTGPDGSTDTLNVQVASYDLAVGKPQRFIVGLLTLDQEFVSHGSVDMSFAFAGTKEKPVDEDFGKDQEAEFLPLPGEPESESDRPSAGPGSHGRGVYGTQAGFDRAGFWKARVKAPLSGKTLQGVATFEVFVEHRIPAPGDPALRTDNHVLSSPGIPQAAIDSRAATGEIPDSHLHEATVAQAMDQKRPALVIFSTPAYCISRFCGPVTDMIADLARQYSSKAVFIHVEIWRDHNAGEVNKAAADWLLKGGDLQEPWVFLIGSDGVIAARWDNVATRSEVEGKLMELPG